MSSFPYQQHPLSNYLLTPTVFFPDHTTTTTMSAATWQLPADHFHQPDHHNYDQVPVANTLLMSPESSMSMVVDDHKLVDHDHQTTAASTAIDQLLLPKKRKDKVQDFSSNFNQAQSKDTSYNRLKKQKKTNGSYQEKKKKKSIKKGSCDEEEGAIGYIHVRARRGQATDSHSLAERVRREKISERMKLLQAIVPGCDKVTGKALMLDEIINYVQSLQNQVEFLSLKLATVNPISYDFGVDMDTFMLKPDENMSSMGSLPIMPSVQRCSPNGGAATFSPTNGSYNHRMPQLSDSSTATNSLLFQQSQMPNIILSQENGHQLWDVDEQRLKLDNCFAVSNNSFH